MISIVPNLETGAQLSKLALFSEIGQKTHSSKHKNPQAEGLFISLHQQNRAGRYLFKYLDKRETSQS